MTLYTLLFGKSKKNMRPIMVDQLHKVEEYKRQREISVGTKASVGWHSVEIASKDAKIWRKKPNGKWKNYNVPGPKVVR